MGTRVPVRGPPGNTRGISAQMTSRRTLLGGTLLLPAAARAQPAARPFPEHPVRYVVPFAPGGLTDVMARLVGQKLGERWGRAVVIDNRPGGNAMIGADIVAKAAPDGHTLLATTLAHAVNATLFPAAPYDFRRDLATLCVLGSLPLAVVVNVDNPARTLDELARRLRERPSNAGSSGSGTPPHLGLELLRRAVGAGERITHVPYRGGAPSITDLVAGNLDLIVSNLPECLPQLRGGRLRALAVTSPGRHPLVPDVPTTAEAGFPSVEISSWTAVAVAAGTPEPMRARLAADIVAAVSDSEVTRRAAEGGFTVLAWNPARSEAFVRAETERWATVVREAGISAEG